MTSEVIDVESTALTVQPAATPSLFGTTEPTEIVGKARDVANALKDVLRQQGLLSNISGKEYVQVGGWTLLGTMLGVFPVLEWCRPLENGWEARVEARTLSGAVVGAAEAECTRDEGMWKKRDDYALRSMAQTRATSKALRMPLGFVVTLAGFEATPAEEMTFAERPAFNQTGAVRAPQAQRNVAKTRLIPSCPAHGQRAIKLVPAGISKKTDKPYDAFYTCDVKGCEAGDRGRPFYVDADAWQAVKDNSPIAEYDPDDVPDE